MNPIFDNLGRQPRWLIENLIGTSYVVDVGVVIATDQSTVDVQHAVQQVRYGKTLPATVTRKIEVLWPFPGTWQISVGDPVLLLGTKDYVESTKAISVGPTDVPLHYTQTNLKAVPIYPSGTALIQIKNAAASLYTIVQNLVQGIQGGTYGGAGAPGPFVDTTGKVAAALTQLGQLLKA